MIESDTYDRLCEAADAIRATSSLRPQVALVLGSGLGSLADEVSNAVVLPYHKIPHFPVSTAPGHAGKLVLGRLEGRQVAVMAGRAHLYEGYSAQQVVLPTQVMRQLGAETLIITNAAGGVNLAFQAGALMLITDHINLTGRNPLVGPNEPRIGVRFPDMSEPYSSELRAKAHRAAASGGLKLEQGIYLGLLGPNYETPAEIRLARSMGADAVGMSTVMEVIAANHGGMQVLGISCITNMAAGILPRKLTEEEVLETAMRVRGEFSMLIKAILVTAVD